jgi:hypothetical protein
MAEHIADGHVRAAGVIQRGHDIRSDKTGSPGHKQHEVPDLMIDPPLPQPCPTGNLGNGMFVAAMGTWLETSQMALPVRMERVPT